MTPEQQQRFQEMMQHAMQQSAHNLTPEQMQAMQAAMSRMQQHMGASGFNFTVVQSPDGTVGQQGAIGPQTGWPQPGQGHSDPYIQRQFEFAAADLKRWLTQYGQYRGQGQFAALEAVFQAAQHIPG